jgi:hypothetical protein
MNTSASTNPFLAMLAAVDDRASQTEPYNNGMGTSKSADIKLPEIWPSRSCFIVQQSGVHFHAAPRGG